MLFLTLPGRVVEGVVGVVVGVVAVVVGVGVVGIGVVGHLSVLHILVSRWAPSHGFPPFSGQVLTSLNIWMTPPPHVLLQGPMVCHSVH